MAASLTASTCRNPKYDEEKRLRFCGFSIATSRVSLSAFEPHKLAPQYMERGIIRANTGNIIAAKRDMQRALEMASFGKPRVVLLKILDPEPVSPIILNPPKPSPWLQNLIARAESDVTPGAKRLWDEVVEETLQRP